MSGEPRDAAALDRALDGLRPADVDALLEGVADDEVEELLALLGCQVPVRHLRRGPGAVVVQRRGALPAAERRRLAEALRALATDRAQPDAEASARRGPGPLERLAAAGRDGAAHEEPPVDSQVRGLHATEHHGLGPPHALSSRGVVHEHAPVDWHDLLAAADPTESLLEDDGLLSGLDHLLLRAVFDADEDAIAAPSSAQVARLVEERAQMGPNCPAAGLLIGLASVLHPPCQVAGRRRGDGHRWYLLGRIAGLIRTADLDRLCAEVTAHRHDVAALIADPFLGAHVVDGIVRALLPDHAPVAAELLRARAAPFAGAPVLFRIVYGWARSLVVTERAAEAETLFLALEGLPLRDPDATTRAQRLADLQRRRVTCKRSLGEFAAAEALLDTLDPAALDDRNAAAVHAERGLVAARAGHLRHITFPRDEAGRAATIERVTAGAKHFEEALARNPDDVRACHCLGALAVCQRDHARAAVLLEHAEAGLVYDPVLGRTGMLEATRFHRAAALLLTLEPGTDAPAVAALARAVDGGFRPSAWLLREVGEALAAHGSRRAVPLVRHCRDAGIEPAALAELVEALAAEDDPDLAELAAELGMDARLPASRRYAMLELALRGLPTGAEIDHVVNAVDELLRVACDPALEERWERLLGEEDSLREALEPAEADLLRVGTLQRLGRVSEARAVAVGLYYRAAAGALERHDPEDLLELVERLGAGPEELADLRRALPGTADDDAYPHDLDRPVRVVFVGGNEVQAQFYEQAGADLAEAYGPRLEIRWHLVGWSPNWLDDAKRVEADLDDADALVLMAFMRTTLGRRLRRAAGERDVVWRACTGSGKASLERSIAAAVEAVRAR